MKIKVDIYSEEYLEQWQIEADEYERRGIFTYPNGATTVEGDYVAQHRPG